MKEQYRKHSDVIFDFPLPYPMNIGNGSLLISN